MRIKNYFGWWNFVGWGYREEKFKMGKKYLIIIYSYKSSSFSLIYLKIVDFIELIFSWWFFIFCSCLLLKGIFKFSFLLISELLKEGLKLELTLEKFSLNELLLFSLNDEGFWFRREIETFLFPGWGPLPIEYKYNK